MSFLTDPINWWIDPFTSTTMRSALLAALLAVVCTSLVGTWVVIRGMSFFGEALSHGVLPGVAVAYTVGFSTTLGAFVAAGAMVALMKIIRARSPLPDDTTIGILFAGFLSLAVVIMSKGGSYAGDLTDFLFGSITTISSGDLIKQAVAAALVLVVVVVFYRPLLALTFDETLAKLLGMRPALTHATLLGLLAIAVVASFETIGNLLVVAFLIAPPSAAALLIRRVPYIMIGSIVIGSVAVIVGLLVSYHYSTAPGATMSLMAVCSFLLALVANSLRRSPLRRVV
ncbi:MAG: metal ABC transporter permease [Acidimicrobiales bacterium]